MKRNSAFTVQTQSHTDLSKSTGKHLFGNNTPPNGHSHAGEVIIYVLNDGNAKVEAISGSISAYGYTPDEFIAGKISLQDIIHGDDLQTIMAQTGEHLENKLQYFSYDCRIFDKSGTPVWITNTVMPTYNAEGEATRFFVKFESINRDMQHERMPDNADEKLLDTSENKKDCEKQNNFRSFFEHSADGIVFIDTDGIISEWSRGYEQITGISRKDAVGHTLWEIISTLLPPEEQNAGGYAVLEQEIKSQIYGEQQGMVIRKIINRVTGLQRTMHVVYFPVNISGAAMLGAISRDVTEMLQSQELLRQSEQKLRESNEILESIMEAVPAPLYVKNRKGEYIQCNKEFVKMTDYSKEQIIGKTVSDILPQYADRVVQIDQRLLNETNDDHTGIISDYFAEIESMVYRNFLMHNGRKEGIVGVLLNVSELKRTERRLIAEKNRLEALGDHFPNGCLFRLEIDRQTGQMAFSYLSKTWERLTGLGLTETMEDISHSFAKIHPDDLPLMLQRIKNLDEQNDFNSQVRYHYGEGDTRWLQASAHCHLEENQWVYDGFIVDITSRKLADIELERYRDELELMVKERTEELETTNEELHTTNEELHQYREHLEQMVEQKTREVIDSRERLVSLSKHLTGGVIFQVMGKDLRSLRFSFISAYFTKLFGIDVNDVMAQSKLFYRSIHPDDLLKFKRHYIKAFEHGDPGISFRILNRRGDIKWVNMRASHRIVDEMHVWDGFMLDITPHKLAEQELESSCSRQNLLYRVLQIFQSTEDVPHAINFALKEVGRYAKVDRMYIVENGTGDIYEWCNTGIPSVKEQFRHIAGTVQAVTDVLKADKYVQTSDLADLSPELLQFQKDTGILSMLGFPLTVDGVYYGLAGFDDCKTIRDWNRNEIDLLGGLSQIIANAIRRKKAEQELIRAKDQAEEADRLKSSFLANISHELRTPLNGITGYLQFLTSGNISPELRQEYVQVVNACSRQLIQLIEDVIDIAKMEANQLKIFPRVTDINRMMHDLLLLLETELKMQDKSMVVLLLDDTGFIRPGIIYVDPARLQQILFHLVGNAIKFTQKGHIRFGYRLQPNGMLEFTVEDTGIGIPEDKYGVIFERFRQIEQGNNRFYGGTGIGLSIAQSLVQLMGGRMYLQSAVGKGSTFSFTIPYQPVAPGDIEGKLK